MCNRRAKHTFEKLLEFARNHDTLKALNFEIIPGNNFHLKRDLSDSIGGEIVVHLDNNDVVILFSLNRPWMMAESADAHLELMRLLTNAVSTLKDEKIRLEKLWVCQPYDDGLLSRLKSLFGQDRLT